MKRPPAFVVEIGTAWVNLSAPESVSANRNQSFALAVDLEQSTARAQSNAASPIRHSAANLSCHGIGGRSESRLALSLPLI
jgi:hypothetical protein